MMRKERGRQARAISIFLCTGRGLFMKSMQNRENAWVCLARKDIRVNTVKRQRKMKKRI